MDHLAINEADLLIEILVPEELTGADLADALTTAPIRLTHLPTGTSAIGEGQGNQVKNREKALALLRQQLKRSE